MELVETYHSLKEGLVSWSGQSHTLWHVQAGIAIYLLLQVVRGTRRGSVPALTVVLMLECLNEVFDRLHYGSWRIDDTLNDIFMTMIWPCMMVAVSHFRRWKWRVEMEARKKRTTRPAAKLATNTFTQFVHPSGSTKVSSPGNKAEPPQHARTARKLRPFAGV